MIRIDSKTVLTVAALVVGGFWYLQQKQLFSVTDPENPINETAEEVYTAVTGSEETPGADLYELLHEDATNPWGWYNPLYYLTEGLDRLTGVK